MITDRPDQRNRSPGESVRKRIGRYVRVSRFALVNRASRSSDVYA
ncbi:hypothetical protein HALLA_17800 [Halostagnicola larsenii XH-48]|uniref:Uncharacterized protein n=1 Tax=Halostagnicola larsenii XH-48 TaxID=797299 RepID=W0JV44_9EURY|nr:hypothetical protein HALLA_17800 [Halostagnicola larsenii XH-48]